jgi:DNA-binding MarR family transcriptional regulator
MASVQSLARVLRQVRQATANTVNLNFVECLLGIAGREGITPSELALALGQPESTVSRVCSQLEDPHRLIVRNPHPTEYRAKVMYLTKEGKELLKVIEAELN